MSTAPLSFEPGAAADTEYYQALLAKDGTYEGTFIAAVKTTGIFCRPTCRARKPKRENVEFYASTGAAGRLLGVQGVPAARNAGRYARPHQRLTP